MHYHCEIWVPNKISYEEAKMVAEEIMEPYSEDHEEGEGAFWDWWVLGGRYTGRHDGYKPWEDYRNYETCHVCKGTGRRGDYKERSTEFAMRGCNGCAGTGVKLKYQYEPHEGDVLPLKDVRDNLTPYTLIIAKDGEEPIVEHAEVWAGRTWEKKDFNECKDIKAWLKKEYGIENGYLITVDYHC